MQGMEITRFVLGTAFLLIGIVFFLIEMIGVYKFKYVLNRMHVAAIGDTLGISCMLIGLMIFTGLNLTSLKMFCIIVFLWFSSPTSSHLIARLEVTTNDDENKQYYSFKINKNDKEVE